MNTSENVRVTKLKGFKWSPAPCYYLVLTQLGFRLGCVLGVIVFCMGFGVWRNGMWRAQVVLDLEILRSGARQWRGSYVLVGVRVAGTIKQRLLVQRKQVPRWCASVVHTNVTWSWTLQDVGGCSGFRS